jgi:hypothetical protein
MLVDFHRTKQFHIPEDTTPQLSRFGLHESSELPCNTELELSYTDESIHFPEGPCSPEMRRDSRMTRKRKRKKIVNNKNEEEQKSERKRAKEGKD